MRESCKKNRYIKVGGYLLPNYNFLKNILVSSSNLLASGLNEVSLASSAVDRAYKIDCSDAYDFVAIALQEDDDNNFIMMVSQYAAEHGLNFDDVMKIAVAEHSIRVYTDSILEGLYEVN